MEALVRDLREQVAKIAEGTLILVSPSSDNFHDD